MSRSLARDGRGEMTDPSHLRVVYDVLNGLVEDFDPAKADVTNLLEVLVRRRQQVQDRLNDIVPDRRDRRPVVLDPGLLAGVMSRQGQPLTPVITSDVAATDGLSSAQVWMPPHHSSFAHVHHHTGVSVLVMQGRAITLWWDEDGEMHELPQAAGQHLFIPHGVPHAAINPHPVPVVAAEFRSNPVFNSDNELLPALDVVVAARMAAARGAAA